MSLSDAILEAVKKDATVRDLIDVILRLNDIDPQTTVKGINEGEVRTAFDVLEANIEGALMQIEDDMIEG